MSTTYTGATNTPLYNALINKVYDWSNRDLAALPSRIVEDSVRYAADTAYRTLRIPPLENTLVWDDIAVLEAATSGSATIYQSVTLLSIPPDLTEFIQIRGTDAAGLTTRVFNEKADVRTFQDISADVYNASGFWTRMGNNVLITPSFANAARGFYGGGSGPETRIEMYYYRRLPALNAIYDISITNLTALDPTTVGNTNGLVTAVATGTTGATEVYYATTTIGDVTSFTFSLTQTGSLTPVSVLGNELPHWLRDQNEKAVLMGGLAECFAYLQEDDQATKYLQLFQKEITELNDEDRVRDASGGNIQVHYNGRGLI